MQLYTHFTPPSYKALETVPENRVYVSADRADSFAKGFLAFSHGNTVSDDAPINGGATIDHETARKRRFVAVEK